MNLTIGLQQTIVTVKRSNEQATIGLCWSEVFLFFFPFIANISNVVMSNQNAQIQRYIYEMYSTKTCSLCEISVKQQCKTDKRS